MRDITEYDLALQQASHSAQDVSLAIADADIALADASILLQETEWNEMKAEQAKRL